MDRFYVVGGRQKPGVTHEVKEWHQYGAGVICEVDVERGTVDACVEYVSPPDAVPEDDPSIVFKTATLVGDRMYVPTQTELLTYRLPSFERIGYVSLPRFNDVHHVAPGPGGNLFVANTGLDQVVEVTQDGDVVRHWSVISDSPWGRFSPDVDYRKVPSTKPHDSHPNHVFFLDGEVWVSRCNQFDARCLTASRPDVAVADRWIHDGLVRNGRVYFTAVNGQVVILDAHSREVIHRYDLNRISAGDIPLGWCRGIEVLDGDKVVVGFSRLRQTKWKQKVQWAKHKLGGDGLGLLPTRIACFDLAAEKELWNVDVEPAGMNVVFSVHRVPRF